MPDVPRRLVDRSKFNVERELPFELRIADFELAMQDVYDFFHDVNQNLLAKGLRRLDDLLRPAAMSGLISDLMTASLGRHARSLVENKHFNGHPDLIVNGIYPNNTVAAGAKDHGVEVKSTRKRGGAVDTHGARAQWMCVFVYEVDVTTEPVTERRAMRFTEAYLADVDVSHVRRNARGELGTRTATLDRSGLVVLRAGWLYLDR